MTAPAADESLYDPVALAAALIRCPSVTPDAGAGLDLLQSWLAALGFSCRRMPFSEPGEADVDNLYARLGDRGPHLCFAGHMDVVPPGDDTAWETGPFAATIRDGTLYGRGAVDMKGAVAAFVAAVADYCRQSGAPRGSVSLLITGDEEGPAVNGTCKMLAALAADGEVIDDCLVGEPTNPDALGDMVKIGRRGSLNAVLTVHGVQGHVAYPQLADNPLPPLVRMLDSLVRARLDGGTEHFQPSNLELTSIDTGNPATNVIPAAVRARFNIRFNDTYSPDALEKWLRAQIDNAAREAGAHYHLDVIVNGECFLTPPGSFVDLVSGAVHEVTGRKPALSTGGGTSDARFIKDYARVLEFGLVGKTMHKTDEGVALEDLTSLARIYSKILAGYFASSQGAS